jgi:hypothetical protein
MTFRFIYVPNRARRTAGALAAVLVPWFAVPGALAQGVSTEVPRVFLLDPQEIAQVRERVAEEPALRPALEKLLAEAAEALEAGPFSVVHQTLLPPSGDKHDYLSFGPYWWPDPSKPDGLPYIRRDGELNPEARDDRSDRVALGRMINAVKTLALACYLEGEPRYAERAALLLRTWFLDPATRMNPHLQYGQAIPGRVEGRDIGIIDTRALSEVVDALGLLGEAEAWTGADQAGMVEWFNAYLDWLLTSNHGRGESRKRNNHGTWYDVQVASYALFVGREELARRVLEEARTRRIASQIEPDGRQPHELARTRALGYTAMNLHGMMMLARLGDRAGVDLWRYQSEDGRSIRTALDWAAPYADPAKEWPYPQITAPEAVRGGLLAVLRLGAIAYRQPQYEQLIHRLPGGDVQADRIQLLYPAPPF